MKVEGIWWDVKGKKKSEREWILFLFYFMYYFLHFTHSLAAAFPSLLSIIWERAGGKKKVDESKSIISSQQYTWKSMRKWFDIFSKIGISRVVSMSFLASSHPPKSRFLSIFKWWYWIRKKTHHNTKIQHSIEESNIKKTYFFPIFLFLSLVCFELFVSFWWILHFTIHTCTKASNPWTYPYTKLTLLCNKFGI